MKLSKYCKFDDRSENTETAIASNKPVTNLSKIVSNKVKRCRIFESQIYPNL